MPPAEADEEPPAARKRTRATSRQPSQEPTSQAEPEEPPRRRVSKVPSMYTFSDLYISLLGVA